MTLTTGRTDELASMTGITDRAFQAIDDRLDDHIELLAHLVRAPSLLGGVRPAQEILFHRLKRMGLAARMQDIALDTVVHRDDYAPVPWSAAGQPNVWGILPPTGDAGRSLVLNGHIDVVPPGPTQAWTYDPWGAAVIGDRMYGRGAMDMKGGLVAGLLAMQAVIDAGVTRNGAIIFESVIEEECTGNGMLAQRLQTGSVDAAIILEPTGESLWMATLGVVWFTVTVTGKPAYVGRSDELVNAVETAAALVGRLKPSAVSALNAAFDEPAYAGMHNPLTLNVGKIQGGDWPSNVPMTCSFTCRMSYPIDWTFDDARSFVEEQVSAACGPDPWLAAAAPSIAFDGFRARGWRGKADWELIQVLAEAHRAETGESLAHTVFPGTADARYFGPDEQVTYFGPHGGGIHSPDEFVELSSIRRVARTLVRHILTWCC